MELTGQALIADERVTGPGEPAYGVDPATGKRLDPPYPACGPAEVDRACALAEAAFDTYRSTTTERRAAFLDLIAARIEAHGEQLIDRAVTESALPEPRIRGELARTTGQLRLFAEELRAGHWHGARIDPGNDNRPDIRQRRIPLGPVAVFGASNFPLAFSVGGGDTASALAAGCPVVVKAHEAHPGTCELAGVAIAEAVAEAGLPAGVFSLLYGDGPGLGGALVTDPRIAAVGFTGSRRAGLSIVESAARRPRPIPVYAEMSSTNPVFLLPEALRVRGESIASGFVGSMTLGAGQFCTNPGLVFAVDGPGLDAFLNAAAERVRADEGAAMLTAGIADAYARGTEQWTASPVVTVLAEGKPSGAATGARSVLGLVEADKFDANPALRDEVFGAASLVVRCTSTEQLIEHAGALDGQLTATIHGDDGDTDLARRLLPVLERTAGRVLWNGWPTGVQVGHAMVHGGPYPSTSDSRTTSVGTLAIERFLRPVAYQDVPAELLPGVLRDEPDEQAPRRISL